MFVIPYIYFSIWDSLLRTLAIQRSAGEGKVPCLFFTTTYLLTFTCSKSAIETLEKGIKHVQS